MLAEEIYGFFRSQPVGSSVAAVLPCGTGATAYLVHREIRRLMGVYEGEGRLEVFGVGCVGGERGGEGADEEASGGDGTCQGRKGGPSRGERDSDE